MTKTTPQKAMAAGIETQTATTTPRADYTVYLNNIRRILSVLAHEIHAFAIWIGGVL